MGTTLTDVERHAREREWSIFLASLRRNQLRVLFQQECLVHDLYLAGELNEDHIRVVLNGQVTWGELFDDLDQTSILSYKCILCRDTGCEFCPGVD